MRTSTCEVQAFLLDGENAQALDALVEVLFA
jgi:hypothetical protein